MKIKDLKKILDLEYKEKMKSIGFVKKNDRFVQSTSKYLYEFGYVIFDYGNVYVSQFSFSLKSISYSRILSVIYGKELSPFVFYIRQGSLYEKDEYPVDNYFINTETEILKMVIEVVDYFENKALPYLLSISNIESIDKKINTEPIEPTEGVKGLIIARLNENPNYEKLKQTYRQLFTDRDWAIGEDIENLEKTIVFLDNHSKEELEEIANFNNQ